MIYTGMHANGLTHAARLVEEKPIRYSLRIFLIDELQYMLRQTGLIGFRHMVVIVQKNDQRRIDDQKQAADKKPTQYHGKAPPVNS
jgi:hypothetical protein